MVGPIQATGPLQQAAPGHLGGQRRCPTPALDNRSSLSTSQSWSEWILGGVVSIWRGIKRVCIQFYQLVFGGQDQVKKTSVEEQKRALQALSALSRRAQALANQEPTEALLSESYRVLQQALEEGKKLGRENGVDRRTVAHANGLMETILRALDRMEGTL